MLRSGGAVTHMQKNINLEVLRRVTYLIGSEDLIAKLPNVPAIVPFHAVLSIRYPEY